jgi:hypothetical protein
MPGEKFLAKYWFLGVGVTIFNPTTTVNIIKHQDMARIVALCLLIPVVCEKP